MKLERGTVVLVELDPTVGHEQRGSRPCVVVSNHPMSTLTIRVPEDKHARLRSLAKARGISINKLLDELATVALAQHDAVTRFRALAARGSGKAGLELLDKLDRAFTR